MSGSGDPVGVVGRARIDVLQAARGIAALWVKLFHARAWEAPRHGVTLLDRIVAPAPSCIDMFFAVSGFVMVYVTRQDERTLAFLIRRFCRIWPSYAAATGAVVLAELAAGHGLPGPDRVIRSLLFLPVDPTRGAPFFGPTVLHVGWSLSYEMLFYGLFGLSLAFGRFRSGVLLGTLAVLLVGLPLAHGDAPTLDVWRSYGFRHRPMLNLATAPMLWAFVPGVLLGLAHRAGIGLGDRNRVLRWVAGSLALCLAALWSGWAATFEPFRACVAWVPLLGSCVVAERIGAVRVPRPLVWLGEISFAVYLLHPVVIALMTAAMPGGAAELSPDAALVASMLAALLTVGVATVSHAVLEVRLSTWLRDRLLAWEGMLHRPA